MARQALLLVMPLRLLDVAMRLVAGGALELALAAREATAEGQGRPLGPDELRAVRRHRPVRRVAFVAGLEAGGGGRARRLGDRHPGEPRFDGLDVVQPRPVTPLAADAAVLGLRAARAGLGEVEGPIPGRVAMEALA